MSSLETVDEPMPVEQQKPIEIEWQPEQAPDEPDDGHADGSNGFAFENDETRPKTSSAEILRLVRQRKKLQRRRIIAQVLFLICLFAFVGFVIMSVTFYRTNRLVSLVCASGAITTAISMLFEKVMVSNRKARG
jgi:hypothetical protein